MLQQVLLTLNGLPKVWRSGKFRVTTTVKGEQFCPYDLCLITSYSQAFVCLFNFPASLYNQVRPVYSVGTYFLIWADNTLSSIWKSL